MIIVSDTSVVLNLAIIGRLDLLQEMYGTILIPQAVYDEIMVAGALKVGAREIERADWIEVRSVTNRPLVTSLEGELDAGEAEAIVLAVEVEAALLLMDERKGRAIANRLGVSHTGVLGILAKAKHDGLIAAIGPVMDSLMSQAGFWISKGLYNHILQVTHESV